MQAFFYRDESGFEQLAAEWEELLGDSQANTIFMTHAWQSIWWQHLGQGELNIVAVRDEDGRLLGLAPTFARSTEGQVTLHTVGCVDVSDYLDWIVRRGYEQTVYPALLDALAGPEVSPWTRLSLCNLPEGSPSLTWLPELAQARGWTVERSVDDVAPILELPASWDDYLAALPGKARRELRRKLRRGHAAELLFVGPEQDLDQEVDAFIELLIKSHPEKASFMDEANRAFFHAISRATFDAGQLQLAFLTYEGARTAAYMNFLYRDRVLVYNSGLDPAEFGWLSPGIVLMALLIQDAIQDERFAIFDFLRGDETYKYRLGGVDTQVQRLLMTKA